MISTVIKERMTVVGMTQTKLSSAIGCTPTQLSLFLKGKASLNWKDLNKCLEVLGIQIDYISKRIELARKVASILSKLSIDKVIRMDRATMIKLTGYKQLLALPEVTEKEFEYMLSSEIGDYESTFPYFKTLVIHFMKMPHNPTPKMAEASLISLAYTFISSPFMPILGISYTLGASVAGLALSNKKFSKAVNNAWGIITTLTVNLFKF